MDEFNTFADMIRNVQLSKSVTPLEILQKGIDTDVKYKMEMFVTSLQAVIIEQLSIYEPSRSFKIDQWQRDQGGGGITCVLQEGDVFEKVGVNISSLSGEMRKEHVELLRSRGKDISLEGWSTFFATGVSCLIYPTNPFVPSLHFNYRYFEVTDSRNKKTWWFGGSCDLFPNYVNEEDFSYFHQQHKKVCDEFDVTYYPKYKKACDDYNYNKHRGEHCGIGGIFIDDFDDKSVENCCGLVMKCASTTLPTYLNILKKRKDIEYTEKQRKWQLIRRGRYVEFNLVYGRGTRFGLNTPGVRIESVLMTMPLTARWEYMYEVEKGSDEERMMEILKSTKEWVT